VDDLYWNREFALVQTDGDEDLVLELLELFVQSSVEVGYEQLMQYMRGGDVEGVVSVVHGIKGAAASLGLETISELCKEIELAGREGVIAEGASFNRLGVLLEQVKSLINRAA